MIRAFTISGPVWKSLSIPALAWSKRRLEAIGAWCGNLSVTHPRVYLLLAAGCALVGYLYPLLFPWLVFMSVPGIYRAAGVSQGVAWEAALGWLLAGGLSVLVSYRLARFRPVPPAGKVLERKAHPALFQLIDEQSGHYRSPRIDRVVLSAGFELDILKTPRFALPVWSTNTLLVGLSLLQCLSATQFQCALGRRLGQFSKRYNRLENWLYQLRGIWPLYCTGARHCGFGCQPIAWFYCMYAPFYNLISAPAACRDELAADSYAMELFSDEEVLDTITTLMVCSCYLEEKYWPVVRKYALGNHRTLDKLRAGMTSVLRAGLHANNVEHWVAKALSATEPCTAAVPSLARRIENIGCPAARMGALSSEPAAGIYLE